MTRQATKHEPEEYKVALRVIAAYDAQDTREGEKGRGCHFFMEQYVDPLMTESSDNLVCGSPRDELFTFLFVRAAEEYRDAETPNHWTDLLDILDRAETEEGFDFEKEREERDQRWKEIGEQIKAEELAKPEPKDRLSDAWRYWKLRRIEHAFASGSSASLEDYAEAWDYARELLLGLVACGSFWRVDFILPLLPQLIIARQQIDEADRYERRVRAGMKGAETRKRNKAKAAKKGGKTKTAGK
jgi:hypothetical protein